MKRFIIFITNNIPTIDNAIPTAEGAIELAMHTLPITIQGSKCLVLGFGRIGKVLSKMLYGLSSDVTVEARRFEDLAWIRCYGYNAVHLNNLNSVIGDFDIIFNTVPSDILSYDTMLNIKKSCLIIDLASANTGINADNASSIGLNVINALSLPGKVAPVSSGMIIKDTVLNIISELGV